MKRRGGGLINFLPLKGGLLERGLIYERRLNQVICDVTAGAWEKKF